MSVKNLLFYFILSENMIRLNTSVLDSLVYVVLYIQRNMHVVRLSF
jgi:hypothetical protein